MTTDSKLETPAAPAPAVPAEAAAPKAKAAPKVKAAAAPKAKAAPKVKAAAAPKAEPVVAAPVEDEKAVKKDKKKDKKAKKKDKKKKEAVIIRFDDEQLPLIDARAEALGLSRAAWVRMVVSQALAKA